MLPNRRQNIEGLEKSKQDVSPVGPPRHVQHSDNVCTADSDCRMQIHALRSLKIVFLRIVLHFGAEIRDLHVRANAVTTCDPQNANSHHPPRLGLLFELNGVERHLQPLC